MLELLRTKLFIPRPRPDQVARLHLTSRLTAGLDRKLTLLAAPAGFGKTTLLSEWIPQSPHCVTWLSLDEGDNDPVRFWTYLIASVQQIHPDLGERALAMLQSHQAPPIYALLTSLINDIAAYPDHFSTVLDDYHAIDSQPIHTGLAYLIEHLPANHHFVIATRVDPPLSLARLRGRGQLTELRARDLRFSESEAAVFLTSATGKTLSAEDITALEARTEGWIAGLQIAALSMQGHTDSTQFVQAFSGSHRHILGYLAEEVLSQRPKGTLNFLLQTSILDRLCGPLCDAVTGEAGSQAILEVLEQANLFISALDDEKRWFRYHHLFAEVLRARLQHTSPEQVPELHHRAANWFANQDRPAEAVEHALACGDHSLAADFIESIAGKMLRSGASATLAAWLDALPNDVVRAHPHLCQARAWTYFWGPELNLDRAEEWAQQAWQAAQASQSLSPDLAGEIAALQAMLAATRSDIERCRALSQQALEDLPPESPWRSGVALCLGTSHLDSGDMEAANRVLGEALQLSLADSNYYIQQAAGSFLGDILVLQGRLSHAQEMYQQVLTWAEQGVPQKGAVMANGGLAKILYERGSLEESLLQVRAGADHLDQVGGAWAALALDRVLARIQQTRGQWGDARATLEKAHQGGVTYQVSLVVTIAAALRAALLLDRGDLEGAEAWAAHSDLDPEDAQTSHPGWHEIEYLTLARLLAARGENTRALSLLDRLLQSATAEDRMGSAISILVLQALVLQEQGSQEAALCSLERALSLAEPEGYLHIFVDEGPRMYNLVKALQIRLQTKSLTTTIPAPRLSSYTDRLLAAYSQPAWIAGSEQFNSLSPLTERELEILQLLADGLSNQEIAARLVVAVSTVKSHLNSLYSKLGTHRRTQAIAIGRDLGLIADSIPPSRRN